MQKNVFKQHTTNTSYNKIDQFSLKVLHKDAEMSLLHAIAVA